MEYLNKFIEQRRSSDTLFTPWNNSSEDIRSIGVIGALQLALETKREGLEKLYCFLPEQLERREDALGGHLESGRPLQRL